MNNIPKTIYLQVNADGELPGDFTKLAEVSWASEKIHKTDIEYRLVEVEEEPLKIIDITYHPAGNWSRQLVFTTACRTKDAALKEFWYGKHAEGWEVLKILVRKEIM